MRWPALLVVWLLVSPAQAGEPVLDLRAAGPAETVFSWARDRCAADDIPDAPARAFRDHRGTVHLVAAHWTNRALTGPRLDALDAACGTLFEARGSPEPAAHDDRVWLSAFHTEDGRTIVALGHLEYQGHRHPGRCAAGSYPACWRNAVVQLVSTDGGQSFAGAGPDGRPAAVAPLPRVEDAGRPVGYFSPSNIVALDGHLYAFVFAEGHGAQPRGPCLLRTGRIRDPTAWRAYDGSGWGISARWLGTGPEQRACAPVRAPGSTITSVVRHRASGWFVALIAARRPPAAGREPVTGVWYLQSRDLLAWSPPRLLLEVPIMFAYPCRAPEVFAYPSLLDPDSPSPTFESVGERAFLYLTRFNMRGCALPMDRDLVRIPVSIEVR